MPPIEVTAVALEDVDEDELQVVVGDVVVVLLDLLERVLVVVHEVVDVQVLSFLDLVDLHLHAKLQRRPSQLARQKARTQPRRQTQLKTPFHPQGGKLVPFNIRWSLLAWVYFFLKVLLEGGF